MQNAGFFTHTDTCIWSCTYTCNTHTCKYARLRLHTEKEKSYIASRIQSAMRGFILTIRDIEFVH